MKTIIILTIGTFTLLNSVKAQLLVDRDALVEKLKAQTWVNDYEWEETQNGNKIELTGCAKPCKKLQGIYYAGSKLKKYVFEPQTFLSGDTKYVCVETSEFTDKKIATIKEELKGKTNVVMFSDKIVIVKDATLTIINKATGDYMQEVGCNIVNKLY